MKDKIIMTDKEALNTIDDLIDKFVGTNLEELHEGVEAISKLQQSINEYEKVKADLELYKKQYKIALSLLKEGYGNEYAEYKYHKDLDTEIEFPSWNEEYEEWILNQAKKEINDEKR